MPSFPTRLLIFSILVLNQIIGGIVKVAADFGTLLFALELLIVVELPELATVQLGFNVELYVAAIVEFTDSATFKFRFVDELYVPSTVELTGSGIFKLQVDVYTLQSLQLYSNTSLK